MTSRDRLGADPKAAQEEVGRRIMSAPLTDEQKIDNLLREYMHLKMVLEYLAEQLASWSSINRETFLEAYTEQGFDELLGDLNVSWVEEAIS